MNALIFFAAFMGALALLVWTVDGVQDGFRKIREARSVARPSPRSPRGTGTDAIENASVRKTGAVQDRPSPNSRSSGGEPNLPRSPATPEAFLDLPAEEGKKHYLIDLWRERHHVGALCVCGVAMHSLSDRKDAEAWCAVHAMFAEQLGA